MLYSIKPKVHYVMSTDNSIMFYYTKMILFLSYPKGILMCHTKRPFCFLNQKVIFCQLKRELLPYQNGITFYHTKRRAFWLCQPKRAICSVCLKRELCFVNPNATIFYHSKMALCCIIS